MTKQITNEELITLQAKHIENLQNYIKEFKEAATSIHYILHNIGAPLNDNCLGYAHKQLGPFFRIDELIEEFVEDDNG